MTLQKRAFDMLVAVLLIILLFPVLYAIYLLILIVDGRPVFYISERMHSNSKGFRLMKFRTMKPMNNDGGASGGHKQNLITKTGAFLRKTKLDETPQLWNVIKGDISFVGPRPPLRKYVENYPDIYEKVLQSRPGITGLASILYHKHEERVLAESKTAEQNERIYTGVCIPRKAQLDLIYQANQNMCFDMKIMIKTVFKNKFFKL